jgi:hypothetical protein
LKINHLNTLINLILLLFINLLPIVSSPAFFGKSGYFYPGLYNSAVFKAAALPKTTMSNKELAPNLFAPCTDAQAASPAAINPGTIYL